jgi:hypothetical protein
MPQGPLQANVAVNQTTLKSVPLQSDQSGNLLVGNGSMNKLNVTTATVIKATPGRICKVSVITAATAGTFGIYDAATTGAAATTNAIYPVSTSAWPAAGTVIPLDFPCLAGIVVNPGTGGVVAVSFD